jgi:hypothetical protein
MKHALIAVVTCLAVAFLCWPQPSAAQPDKSKVKKIMQEKLKNSQALLEGIALSDYKKIAASAEELIQLTKTEEWHAIKTPRYEMNSNEFRRAAEKVIDKANAKNIDGVTLAFFDMTMSCVRCHDYVREVRDVSLPVGPLRDAR